MKFPQLSKTSRVLLSILVVLIAIFSLQEPTIREKDITDYRISYSQDKLYVDLFFSKSFSCKSIMKIMDPKPFDVKNFVYVPSCSLFKDGARITYIQNVRS